MRVPCFLACVAAAAACGNETPEDVCGDGLDLDAGSIGEFGDDAAGRELEALLSATAQLHRLSTDLELDTLYTCLELGQQLQISPLELVPDGGEAEVTAACARVARELGAIIALLPSGQRPAYGTPPVACGAAKEAARSCAESCDATLDPSSVTFTCLGTEAGACPTDCDGACRTTNTAMPCGGSCSASCGGACDGVCTGNCVGTCDVVDANGQCVGRCDGTCGGHCEGRCDGTCPNGLCELASTSTCAGTCVGTCGAAWTPACLGAIRPAAAGACPDACAVVAAVATRCELPSLGVYQVADDRAEDAARLAVFAAAVTPTYPEILARRALFASVLAPVRAPLSAALAASDGSSDGTQARACRAAAVSADAATAARLDRTEAALDALHLALTSPSP